MPRRPLSMALDPLVSRIPAALNLSPLDARVTQLLNAATEILLSRGHWYGTMPTYRVNVTNQVFALPPQFANIEKIAVCRRPVALRNLWYSFQSQGHGVPPDPKNGLVCTGRDAVLTGNSPLFSDIVSPGKKLKAQCDVAADIGKTILALGYDDNGNWIRTQNPPVTGPWQDGELITLSQAPGTMSINNFSQVTGIQKPVTSGQLWLYEHNVAANTDRLVANYQYWETAPYYPRYLLPLAQNTSTQIDLIGKLAFYPVSNPTDWLLISNLEALKYGCLAVRRNEENRPAEAATFLAMAISELNFELQHYTGDGQEPTIDVEFGAPGCEPVEAVL